MELVTFLDSRQERKSLKRVVASVPRIRSTLSFLLNATDLSTSFQNYMTPDTFSNYLLANII
jgi:hypothetical protein